MKRLAHRGYSDLFPENTMSAFEKAVNSSFEGIETDVQMTIDGELLLLHDDKINRTSNGKGVLRNMTFKEAAKIAKEAQPKEMWLTHFSPSLVRPLEYMDTVTDIFENAKAGKDGMSVNLCFED